ncbi:protein kinase [Nannocystis sp. SCPEA4]|uniref:protein kinase domain-containing protein n=1 Tax=Nannocystis sp. SCPEA4 TaxID=2996787 RepID=UPI00226FC8C7|nr:protein kinase [Nannocystis sp. SCPEA4]MCY1055119.1 protein kinase [Nannocystis sp. SCPEA4]
MLAPIPSLPGFRLNSYLGSAPSGHVYRAWDELHGRDVVVKLLDPRRCSPSGLARLAAIAGRAATSPGVPATRFYDVVADPIQPFVVMDLLLGESLQAMLLRTGPMPWERARALGHTIAGALAAAHRAGLVHGALKPTNIFVHGDTVHLTDFGVRSLPEPLDPDALLADAGRMAPEQLRGESADERSDLFGLGLLLFELVTGRLPFEGAPREVFKRQLSCRPPAPSHFVPTLPHVADSMILELLEKNPARRPDSAIGARNMLSVDERGLDHERAIDGAGRSAALHDPPMARRPAEPPPAPLSCPNHNPVVATMALVAVLAAGLAMSCP